MDTKLISVLTACLVACGEVDNVKTDTAGGVHSATEQVSQQLYRTIDQHTLSFVNTQPVFLSTLNIEEHKVGGKYNNRLPDYSVDAMHKLQQMMLRYSAQLGEIDGFLLSDQDKTHRDIVSTIELHYAGDVGFGAGYIDTWAGHLPYIVNQFTGPLMDVPNVMQVQQRLETMQDTQDYLQRLHAFAAFTSQVLEKLKADEAAGVILPKKLFPKTLLFLEKFLSPKAKQHPLVSTFSERIEKIDALSDKQKKQLTDDVATLVENVVYPGYRNILSFMHSQQSRASDNDGIWAQPAGQRFYRHAIQTLADTSLTPEKIHEIGLSEVARISTEMHDILKANGYQYGSVGERMITLSSDSKFLYENSDRGRTQLLDDLNRQIREIIRKTPLMFSTFPKAKVEVRRIPIISEAGEASGYYSSPSLDGSRPGIYWINLKEIKAIPRFSLKTLTYHEAIPGHHFQIALNIAQYDIGLLRQNAPFNTYTEGWALYAELLAKEMGMYEADPWGDLGRLQAELYRAVRLVVDTGIHAKKWTREQAIDYFYTTTGSPKSDIIAEVERYMAIPAQALGYKLGMLQFVQLRQWAQHELGEQFDIQAFHDVVLLPGARPMAQVKLSVENWVEQKKTE